jgi:hypothetical protein
MTSLHVNRSFEQIKRSMRPWLLGIPGFFVIALLLLWYLARLASWVYAVLDIAK